MFENQCPLCGKTDCRVSLIPISTIGSGDNQEIAYSGTCVTCGSVNISRFIVENLLEAGKIERSELLGYLYRHRLMNEKNNISTIQFFKNLDDIKLGVSYPSTPLEQIYLLVEYLSIKQGLLSDFVQIEASIDYPLCFAKNEMEFCYIIDSAYELGYIKTRGNNRSPIGKNSKNFYLSDDFMMLSLDGWEKAHELGSMQPDSKQAFVAFQIDANDYMKGVFQGAISPALEVCGYTPVASLANIHNKGIVDKILADIRRSGLVIAEVTGASQNVYYEAGFASGLGIPVIYCCKKETWDESKQFDTVHIKHILWKSPEDLKEQLVNCIQAIGLSKI